ncbi:cyclin-dependent kinase C-1 isoform X2 [Daucus carota subsp. sativus]|uniref:cyclin-dependent kinase C-1 isoform X2 n=1 Tax=Daucus carota subsp. sativus TaxID=79200 RepID=UPI0007EF376F|nr:PREDICTED: cyclin-dependent kinase C-1-like isoform X2 [Daucus carota subsp. sativus]
MCAAEYGVLNLQESPRFGSRNLENSYEKLQQIGQGTYGLVYVAKDCATGEIVALKKLIMNKGLPGFPVSAIREIKILMKLQHENVTRLKEIVTSAEGDNKYKGDIYMVFEYMDHDLAGLVLRSGSRFTVPQIKCYMKQLLAGLHYCHVNRILHRDIKSSNLLLDNQGNLKLADFGLSRSFSYNHSVDLTNQVITLWYRPSELLLGVTKYGPAVDMWSVGCIFAELLQGKIVLPGRAEVFLSILILFPPDQLKKIFKLCGTPDEINWPGVSTTPWYNKLMPERHMKRVDSYAIDLLEKMLTLDPAQRISAEDALDAEYFWTDPLPCNPKSLPKYESSHEFHMKKRQRQS